MNSTDPADAEIRRDNLHAVEAIAYAYLLEEVRLFAVAERIVELAQSGLLPLGRRIAGTPSRLTAAERTDLYARAFGTPGGAVAAPVPNREFGDLWLRYVSAVAAFARQTGGDAKLAPPVRTAARALAVGASARGAKLLPLARRLSHDIEAVLSRLQDPAIVQALGARDAWQVIGQVNADYLGGAVNANRHRRLADSASALLRWLAAHAQTLDRATADDDLLQAVEQWVAASGVQDDAVDEQSQPVESPAPPAPRVDLPALVCDLRSAVGTAGGRTAPHGTILFQGPGGAGKTLAACIVAAALDLSLFRIDLGRLASTWIEETEKNLEALFARAEAANALLLFDEADALFGKRTEVHDAHDHYANIEIGDLLQRIEEYDGIAILATNLDSTIENGWLEKHRERGAIVRFPRPRQQTTGGPR